MNIQTILSIIVISTIVVLTYQTLYPPVIKHIHHNNIITKVQKSKPIEQNGYLIGSHTSAHSNSIRSIPFVNI